MEFDIDKGWDKVLKKHKKRKIKRRISLSLNIVIITMISVSIYNSLYTKEQETNLNQLAENIDQIRIENSLGEIIHISEVRDNINIDSLQNTNAHTLKEELKYSIIKVPKNKTQKITLCDGSVITLNSNSELRFPETFNNSSTRDVYLTGEAFFSIEKDKTKPFIVHTGDTYVKVLGTEFNVSSYNGVKSQITTLVNGKVNIGIKGEIEEMPLKPGEQSIVNKETGERKIAEVNIEEYIAWKDNLFVFKYRSLEYIMNNISQWYGYEVEFKNNDLKNISYSGKIDRNVSINDCVEMIQFLSGTKMTIEGNIIKIRSVVGNN